MSEVAAAPEKFSREWNAWINAQPYTREELRKDIDASCDFGSSAINSSRVFALIDEVERLKKELESHHA